ncbi:ABC transporter permease [Haematomicrobium sanguinis]|uniref:ABC transporter permease n=1 Tax=Haematomicrobium sanguinis TaxID=479106 RepID=UPI0009498A25|nr:ABC transporter permease [Haematomicrobium sanguinis]
MSPSRTPTLSPKPTAPRQSQHGEQPPPSTPTLANLENGLDHLQATAPATAHSSGTQVRRVALPVIAVVLLIAAWQIYVTLSGQRRDLVPGPLDVAASLGELWREGLLQESVATSLQRGVLGFLISLLIAAPIGLALAQIKPLRQAFGPLISGMQVLPSVAWVPAAIIWFGLSDATVYFVILLGAIPSIINGLLAGVDQIPPSFRTMGTVLGASRTQLATRIILPAALPGFLGGLKQGWAFSWRSLMAAEIIAVGGSLGFGLGSLLQRGRDLADLAMVMSSILVILFVGILVELLIFAPLERRVLRGRGLLAGAGAR